MKRTGGFRRIALRRDRSEGAMIRDGDPGTDRNRNPYASNARFHNSVVSRSTSKNSNVFFCGIDSARNSSRRYSSRRHRVAWLCYFVARLAKLRLFYARREQHRSEQQRSCQIVRSAGNMKRVLRINEPREYSREEERTNNKSD